jgi:hypothetical protein
LENDRTLVVEERMYLLCTKLKPHFKTISDLFGASHPEAIVRTDTTTAGVDYNSSCVVV